MNGPQPLRCSDRSLGSDESIVGTASTVTDFFLLEHSGPWGVDAIDDSRLSEAVKRYLRGLRRAGTRPLLIRGQPSRTTRVFHSTPEGLRTAMLESADDVVDLDLREPGTLSSYSGSLFLVCTHGKHDTCCAAKGRPLWTALQRVAPDETWQVSHIGGDRFAANVLVLPDGLYYGRVGPWSASGLVARHRRGELDLEHLRGRSSLPFVEQAAEIFLRRHLSLPSIAPLAVTGREGSAVSFTVDDIDWRVEVGVSKGPPAQLTCNARGTNQPPVFEVESIDKL